MPKNKHIRFEENSSSSDDSLNEEEFLIINLNLIKFLSEKSFGFQVLGDVNEGGQHYVDSIESNSAAQRAGLKNNDKILKINGHDVENFNANLLIDKLKHETSKNKYKLMLSIARIQPLTDKLSSQLETKCSYVNQQYTNLKRRIISFAEEQETDSSSSESTMPKKQNKKNNSDQQSKTDNQTKMIPIPTISNHLEIIEPIKTLNQIRFERIEQIHFISPQRPFKRPNVPSKTILEVKAKEIQRQLSEQGKYVIWQEIIYELLNQYEGCQHIGDLGLSQADHLQAINDLTRLQKRIDSFLIAYESRLPCVLLLELEQSICNDYNYTVSNNKFNNMTKISKYEELFVGPIIRNQIVRQIFNLTDEIRSIEQLKPIKLINLLKHLESFLNEKELWTSKKINQEEFEKYLLAKLKISSMALIGVKINNLGMLIGSIKNVQYCYSQSLNEVKIKLSDDWSKSLEQEAKFLIKNLNDKFCQFKEPSNYMNKNSVDLIDDLLTLFQNLFNKIELNNISSFLRTIQQTNYLRDCFQLAICIGCNDLDVILAQMKQNKSNDLAYSTNNYSYFSVLKRIFYLIFDRNNSGREIKRFLNDILGEFNLRIISAKSHIKFNEDSDDDKNCIVIDDDNDDMNDNSQVELNERTKLSAEHFTQYIKSKYEPYFTFKFDHLIKMEQELWVPNKEETFLEFLNKNQNIFEQQMLTIAPICNNNQDNEHLKTKRLHLIQHIKQLQNNTKDLKLIENSICLYYQVSSFDQLGLNCSIKKLLKEEIDTDFNDVVYLNSILNIQIASPTDFSLKENRSLLVNKLIECPLLENISNYLIGTFNLDGIDLKQLIIDLNKQQIKLENDKCFKLYSLEIEPNVLLKLANATDIDLLKQAIETGDYVSTIGQLISLIAIKYKGLTHMPRSLIINEIESSMSLYLSKCERKDHFYSFLIELINRIPTRIILNANQILFDYIIGPVAKIENDKQIKKRIFETLVKSTYHATYLDDKIKNFIKIGQICSIVEWSHQSYTEIKDSFTFQEITANTKPQKEQILKKVESMTEMNSLEESQISILNDSKIDEYIANDENNEGAEFNHILSVRKKFGIDIDLDESTRSVTDHVKGVLGRSLESLSNELYNKDMHFVLELIQNADDNKYSDQDSYEPSLIFLIESDKITLFNNEIGFKKKNINAICDVKASTKGKHQRGYIGRKGIGFKSVFTVTNRPEIHSNGYHVQFDLNNGHIGYILPNWIQNPKIDSLNQFVTERINNLSLDKIGPLNTCIQLPLKSESDMQRHKSSLLTNNFNDIKSYLLLFLNRLKYLILIQKNEDSFKERVYYRNDISENLIAIKSLTIESNKTTQSEQKWLVVKECLTVPNNLKPNEEVESTDLCLAFPIDQLSNIKRAKMDVFAYLPLRNFGFQFIIQADFVVPASRQDVTEDSDWNQWLIKQLPHLFIKSLNYFKQFNQFTSQIEALVSYLSFIPLEEEIVGFFQHIPRQIIDLLRNEQFVPAVDINNQTVWKKPFECLMLKEADDFMRQILTSDLLKKHLGRYYLHSSLVDINSKLLLNLGVRYLNVSDLIEILESVFSQKDLLEDVKSTAKWLVIIQHCLKTGYTVQQEEKFIQKLKSYSFIPIINSDKEKHFISLDKYVVFFPLNKKDKIINSIDLELETDLNLLDSQSLLCLDEDQNLQIIQFLKQLGVKTQQPKEIIDNHLIPILSNENQMKPEQMLVLYLIYLHKYWTINNIDLNKLKDLIKVKTNKGFQLVNNVYLTPFYGNKYDLKTMLPSYEWQLIDSVYLNKSVEMNKTKSKFNDQLMLSWRRFFITTGINDIFSPNMIQLQCKSNDLINSPYAAYHYMLKIINDEDYYQFNDYKCDVFDYYTKNISNNFELTNLFRLIEDNWEQSSHSPKPLSFYKNVSVAIVSANKYSTNYSLDKLCESVYLKNLKNTKWILVESNKFNESNKKTLELITNISVEQPVNVFVKEQIFSRYYGLSINYAVNHPAKNNSNFSKDLGFIFEFNKYDFMNQFEQWIHQEDNVITKVNFHASILQMRNIYKLFSSYLDSFETEKNLFDRLNRLVKSKQSFIFVPNELNTAKQADFIEKVLIGKFYSSDQVYWTDPSNLFTKYRSTNIKNTPLLIEPIYNEKMRQIFLEIFEINETPTMIDYINLLEHISLLAATNSTKFSYHELLNDVYTLYEVLVDKCLYLTKLKCGSNDTVEVDDEIKSNLIDLIKEKWIIPCYNNKWLSLVVKNHQTSELKYNNPIIVDTTCLAEKFIDKFDMVVIPVDDPNSNDATFSDLCRINSNMKQSYFLINLLELKLFSKTVILDLENITENLREAPTVQNLCSKLLPLIQSFLFYRKEFKKIYQDFNNNLIGDKLNQMKFYSVGELQNIYRCKHDPSVSVIISNKSCFDTNEKSIYWKYFIRHDILENDKDIIKGFIKLFTKSVTIKTLISEQSERDLTNFCLLMYQFINSKMIDEDIRDIEKEYKLKLSLPLTEAKWSIKEVKLNKPDLLASDDNELEMNEFKKFKSSNIKPSQKLIYEQLSRNQINMPNFNDNINVNNETIAISNEQMDCLGNKVASLAYKMSTNFNIENINHRQTLLNEPFKPIEWSDPMLNSFKTSLTNSQLLNDYMHQIGRYGEIWVKEMLKKQFENELSSGLVKVEWMNEDNESGLPYDFRITFNKTNEFNFIEVKATSKMNQESFPISYKELIFAQNYASQFQIYRLYNAGSEDPNRVEMKIIKDVPGLLNSHEINLFIVI